MACDKILTENLNTDQFFILTSENTFNLDFSRRTELYKAKKATKQCIQEQTLQLWNSKVEKLTMQGDLAQLLIEEKGIVTWPSFALNSATNTLPTPDNI